MCVCVRLHMRSSTFTPFKVSLSHKDRSERSGLKEARGDVPAEVAGGCTAEEKPDSICNCSNQTDCTTIFIASSPHRAALVAPQIFVATPARCHLRSKTDSNA